MVVVVVVAIIGIVVVVVPSIVAILFRLCAVARDVPFFTTVEASDLGLSIATGLVVLEIQLLIQILDFRPESFDLAHQSFL